MRTIDSHHIVELTINKVKFQTKPFREGFTLVRLALKDKDGTVYQHNVFVEDGVELKINQTEEVVAE